MQQKISQHSTFQKALRIALILLCSIAWTLWQMYTFQHSSTYHSHAREICQALGLKNSGTEAQRLQGCLAYLQSLPHILLAYCLLTKCPPQNNRQFIRRILILAFFFVMSLFFFPPLALTVFPAFNAGMLSVNKTYHTMLVAHSILGLLGVPVVAAIFSRRTPARKRIKTQAVLAAAGRFGLVVLIAFLISVAYGFALGILSHFNESAARAVPANFVHDAGLYSGLFCACVMAPLVEEFGYRGMIFAKMKKHLPLVPALILSSLLFAVWHRNLGQLVATFPMGLFFAGIYHRSGKLRYSILLHSLSNFIITLSLANRGSLLPYIPVLSVLRRALVNVSLPVGILGLLATLGITVFILCKGFPKQKSAV